MQTSSVFSSVVWASIQRFGVMLISFISNMVLARLLTPDDFGTTGMLLFFIMIASVFVDSGFGSALIQKKTSDERDYATVFYANLLMAVLLYIGLFISAPFIAKFYNENILCPLLRVEGLVLIFNAFSIIQTTLFRKQLNFKALSTCNLVGNFLAAIISIITAYLGFGVWSLVIRMLLSSFTTSVLLWIAGKWMPIKSFSMVSFKELFNFGGYMLLSSIIFTITNNIQTIVIGKFFKISTVGFYTQANTLKNYISDSLSSVIGQVVYTDFANSQDDNKLIENKVLLGIDVLSYTTGIFMAICILEAFPLINLIYGSQWITTVPYFKILCVGGVARSIQDINYYLIAAKGKSKQLFILNILTVSVYLTLLIISAKFFNVEILLWSMVFYSYLTYFVFAVLASNYIDSNIIKQLRIIIRNIFIVLIPSFLVVALHSILYVEDPVLSMSVDLFVFLVLIFFISYFLKLRPMEYLFQKLFPKIHKKLYRS